MWIRYIPSCKSGHIKLSKMHIKKRNLIHWCILALGWVAQDSLILSVSLHHQTVCQTLFTFLMRQSGLIHASSKQVMHAPYFMWSTVLLCRNLTENCRLRRGENQTINIPSTYIKIWLNNFSINFLPVYQDQSTLNPFVDEIPSTDEIRLKHTRVDHLYADCMGFGFGLCCLQVQKMVQLNVRSKYT